VTLFPTQVGALDAARAASLAARGLTETDPGIQVGDNAAAAILAARANDGASLAQFLSTAPGAGTPGVWVAIGTTPPLLPGWGHVAPWVIHSGAQFRPDQTRWARASEARSRGSSSITRCGEVVESADRRGLTSLRQRSGGPPKRLRAKAEAPALQFDLSRNALDQTVE